MRFGSETKDNVLLTAIATARGSTCLPWFPRSPFPLAMHRGPGDTWAHSGLCYRRGTPHLEKLNLSSWAVGRPAFALAWHIISAFWGCKPAGPLLWRRYCIYLPRLVTIKVSLKRKSETKELHERPRKNYLPTGKRVKISTYENKLVEMPKSDDL